MKIRELTTILARTIEQPAPYGLEKPCRIWQGSRTSGYATMRCNGRVVYVGRWILATTVRKFRGKELACHRCDVHACIEPTHLFHGTHSRNLKDAWHRNRRSQPQTFIEVETEKGKAPRRYQTRREVRARRQGVRRCAGDASTGGTDDESL